MSSVENKIWNKMITFAKRKEKNNQSQLKMSRAEQANSKQIFFVNPPRIGFIESQK